MSDEYIDNENNVSYKPHKPRAVTCNDAADEGVLTCFQVDEEATFESPFVLCAKCLNFKNDRLITNVTNKGRHYSCTNKWKRKHLGNKKRKPNPPLNFDGRLQKVDIIPNQDNESKRQSKRLITPNRKYATDKPLEVCNQPNLVRCKTAINDKNIEATPNNTSTDICNSTINIDNVETPPNIPINNTSTTT